MSLFLSMITAIVAVLLWAYHTQLQSLLAVGSGFTAKTVCSSVFLSGLSVDTVRRYELAGIAASVYSFYIDEQKRTVTAHPIGLTRMTQTAYFLGKRLGCQLKKPIAQSNDSFLGTSRQRQSLDREIDTIAQAFLDLQMTETAFNANHTRAAVVLCRGKVIAEAYSRRLNITRESPLLGWSMTKTVQAITLGSLLAQRQALDLGLDSDAKHLNDLLTMGDVLPGFSESYEITGAVPQMLYDSEDYAEFARAYNAQRSKSHIQNPNYLPLFDLDKDDSTSSSSDWYYSSGVSNVLSKEIRSYFDGNDVEYWSHPFKRVFDRIGADTFACELDPSGTFVASSFCYASAEDWAKLGLLLLNKGIWNGSELLPQGYVDSMTIARKGSGGNYGGSVWLNPASVSVAEYNELSHRYKDVKKSVWITRTLPKDAYYMSGYHGQYVMVIPSLECVIVRLGITPASATGDQDPDETNLRFSRPLFFGTLAKRCRDICSKM